MKKTSPGSNVKSKVGTPAAALQRRVVISTPISNCKQSAGAVAGIRRTSSGRELHDQLRRSAAVATNANGSPGVIRNQAVASNGLISLQDAEAESTHSTAPIPSPLQVAKLGPLVPELSLVIEEKENEPDISAAKTTVFPGPPQFSPAPSKPPLSSQGYAPADYQESTPGCPYFPAPSFTPERQPFRNAPFTSFNVNALSSQKSPSASINLVNPLRFDASSSSPAEYLPPLAYTFSSPSTTTISPRSVRIPMDATSYLVQRLQVQDEEIGYLHHQLQYYVTAYNELIEKTRSCRIVCHTASQTDQADTKEVEVMTDEVALSDIPRTESNHRNEKTTGAESGPGQQALPVNDGNDKALPPPVKRQVEHYPAMYPEGDAMKFPVRSSEVSIMCNQIAAKYLGPDVGGPSFPSAGFIPACSSRAWPANTGNPEAEIWASGVSVATRNYLERHRLVGSGQNGPRGRNLAGESIIEHYDEEDYENDYQEVRHVQEVRTDGYLETDQGRMAIRQTQRNQTVLRSPKKMADAAAAAAFQDGRKEKRAPERTTFNLENLKNLPKLLPKRN